MVFYSKLIGREILDSKGTKIGKLKDLIADFSKQYPSVTDIVFKTKDKKLRKIPVRFLESLEKDGLFLTDEEDKIEMPELDEEKDLTLGCIVLDQQVVDIDDQKVVRVNDIILEKKENDFCFTSIDVGIKGLLRRLGLSKLNMTLLAKVPQQLIKWENVETLRPQLNDIQLKISHDKLAQMHPADIANILEDLTHKERAIIFKSLDPEKAADTLEESEPDIQKSLVKYLKKDRIAQVLEDMTPDEAADLLWLFSKEKIEDYLARMESSKAEVLRNILKYEKDEAGGIMTTEYVSIPSDYSVDQAIQLLREKGKEFEHIHALYVVDEEHLLLGAFSIKDLILNKGDSKVKDIMRKKVFAVKTGSSINEIKELFTKYNLVALPVLSDDGKLLGIIMHDQMYDISSTKA